MINLVKPMSGVGFSSSTEFYTVEETGDSGMSQSGLAALCGVTQPAIYALEKTLINKSPSKTLEPFVGKSLTLINSDDSTVSVNGVPAGNLKIYTAAFCAAVIRHYDRLGSDVARYTTDQFLEMGINTWIQSITGWNKEKPSRTYIPYWYQRIKVALSDDNQPIQTGFFCIYLEMMSFFQELEVRLGYVMPDINPKTSEHLVPDISIGSRFNDWLRSDAVAARLERKRFLGSEEAVDFRSRRQNKDKATGRKIWLPAGTHNHEIRMYNHVYPAASHGDYQVQEARSYPNKYIPIFRHYLETIWIPEYFKLYLAPKSPEGWNQIEASLRQLSSQEKQTLRETLIGKLFPLLPPEVV